MPAVQLHCAPLKGLAVSMLAILASALSVLPVLLLAAGPPPPFDNPAVAIKPGYKLPDANPFVEFCTVRGLNPTDCGNNYYSADSGPTSWAGLKAAAKCAAEADQRSAEVAALYRWIATDPGDMMWYASGGPDGFSPENKRKGEQWWWDPAVQKYYTSVPTPKDRQEAKDVATNIAKGVAHGMDFTIKANAPIAAAAVSITVGGWIAGVASVVTGWAGSFAAEITSFFEIQIKTRGDLAFNHPWTIGKSSSGLYYAGDSFATAPDGSTFPVTPTYPPPGTPGATDGSSSSGGDDSGGSGSGSASGGTGSSGGGATGPATPNTPSGNQPTDTGEIVVTNPWITDVSGVMPGEAIARPVLDKPEKTALQRCIETTEHKIIKEIGTKDIAAWYDVPKSEAEIEDEKQDRLRKGFCDKTYFGEDFCRKWKIKRDTEEVPPDLEWDLKTQQELRQLACPPNPHPERETFCHHMQQEVFKRYFLDNLGEKMSDKALQPILPNEQFPPSTVFPPLDADEIGAALNKLIKKNGNPPTYTPKGPTNPFPTPSKVPVDPPRLPHGGFGLPFKPATNPGSPEWHLENVGVALAGKSLTDLPKPDGWDDTAWPWQTGQGSPVVLSPAVLSAAERLARLQRASTKFLSKKPAGWTTQQWKDLQEALKTASAPTDDVTGIGHDEL